MCLQPAPEGAECLWRSDAHHPDVRLICPLIDYLRCQSTFIISVFFSQQNVDSSFGQRSWASPSHQHPSVTKQHNLVPAKGRWSCAAGKVAAALVFAVKPDVANVDDDVVVADGRRLILTCRVETGSPSPTVTWYINGSLATDAARSLVVDPGARTLVIPSTTRDDSGRYSCVAANAAGSDVTHFDVHVIGLFVSREAFDTHT